MKKRFNTNENSVFFKDMKNFKKSKQHNYLIIRYQSTDMFIRERSLSVSFSRFMSLMGGNLGLLLSLSCVTGIFIFYNYIGASFSPWRRMKRHLGLERPKWHVPWLAKKDCGLCLVMDWDQNIHFGLSVFYNLRDIDSAMLSS